MDHIYKLTFVCLLFVSFTAFADSYPAITMYLYWRSGVAQTSNQQTVCDSFTSGYNIVGNPYPSATCKNASGSHVSISSTFTSTCPAGGTSTGGTAGTCLNAPACLTGQYRNSVTQICQDPVFCIWPEVDDGSGICAVPNECANGQMYNYVTHLCATPPTCAAYEKFNPYTWACELSPLSCPEHTHANTANDKCLPDAPLTCPIGQHDDGTYLCVANDAVHCNDNETHGYIDGIPQCIKKTQTADSKKKSDDFETEKNDAQTALDAAKVAAAAAKAALDADPTNQTKIDANNAAQANLTAATSNLADAIAKLKNQYEESDHKNLAAVEEHLKDMNERETQAERDGFGDVPVAEVLPNNDIEMPSIPSTSVMSCPAPRVLSLHGVSITMSYEPYCDFADSVKPLILTMAYFAGALIILGSFKD